MTAVFRFEPMDAFADDIDPVKRLLVPGPKDALADDVLCIEEQGNRGTHGCVMNPLCNVAGRRRLRSAIGVLPDSVCILVCKIGKRQVSHQWRVAKERRQRILPAMTDCMQKYIGLSIYDA